MTPEDRALKVVESEAYSHKPYEKLGFVAAIARAIREAVEVQRQKSEQGIRELVKATQETGRAAARAMVMEERLACAEVAKEWANFGTAAAILRREPA